MINYISRDTGGQKISKTRDGRWWTKDFKEKQLQLVLNDFFAFFSINLHKYLYIARKANVSVIKSKIKTIAN